MAERLSFKKRADRGFFFLSFFDDIIKKTADMKFIKLALIIIKNLFLIIYDIVRNYIRHSSWKKLVLTALLIVVVVGGIFMLWRKYHPKEDTRGVYEALVQVVDQKASDPVEDKRASLKHGDVIAIFPEGHPWTETEKISYLIVKMKLTQEDADKLTQAITKEIDKPDSEGGPQQETIQARKYTLKINVPTVNELVSKGQPYKEKVFDAGIIKSR